MAAPRTTVDITAAPRFVLFLASGLVTRVIDVPSAKDNAWSAVCADRERAAARAELESVIKRLDVTVSGPAR